jgi:hypothetical protein
MDLDFSDYIEENLGKIMIVVGVLLVIGGVLWLSTVGTVYSAGSFFFGLLFVIFGFFVHLGVFSGGLRSLSGFGTVLICFSVVFFVFAVVLVQFQNINVIGYVREVFRGAPLPFSRMVIATDRPYLWLSDFFMHFGLYFFVAGLILKVYSFFRG